MKMFSKFSKLWDSHSPSMEDMRQKCERELEVCYTKLLTTENVFAWNTAHLLPGTTAVLALMEPPVSLPAGMRYLRNSIITTDAGDGVSCKDRVIYALEVELALMTQLESGHGYIHFEPEKPSL